MGTLDIFPTYVAHFQTGSVAPLGSPLQSGVLHSERQEESQVGVPAARLQG